MPPSSVRVGNARAAPVNTTVRIIGTYRYFLALQWPSFAFARRTAIGLALGGTLHIARIVIA